VASCKNLRSGQISRWRRKGQELYPVLVGRGTRSALNQGLPLLIQALASVQKAAWREDDATFLCALYSAYAQACHGAEQGHLGLAVLQGGSGINRHVMGCWERFGIKKGQSRAW